MQTFFIELTITNDNKEEGEAIALKALAAVADLPGLAGAFVRNEGPDKLNNDKAGAKPITDC
ncbi:MAG TPA: hypothetical protein VLE93_03265 [Candidatus Saccharimonadales bacterium]|nr:hypothetical protein [Candidatus Saccharimonadales bacterium]